MEEIMWNYAYDEPRNTDYLFDTYEENAEWNENKKRPREKFTVQNQLATVACTIFSATHLHNGLNLLEDEQLGIERQQLNPMTPRNKFCQERWYYDKGSSIQTVANWMKKNWYIEWYVTISNSEDINKINASMKKAIDMWNFISCGSAYGDWWTIRKTGIYSENAEKKFVGHARCIVDYVLDNEGDVDYYWCINSYWPSWGIHKGYFKLPANMVKNVYSKLVFIDKSETHLFSRIKEVEKIKQGISLFREVYASTTLDSIRNYFDKVQFWKNLSEIYWTII